MATLNRDAFLALAAVPLAKEEVHVPALGGTVWVHEMTAGQRDKFESEHSRSDGANFRARMTIATVRDEIGRPMFKDADLPALASLAPATLNPIVEAAIRLGKMSDDEVRALEKN